MNTINALALLAGATIGGNVEVSLDRGFFHHEPYVENTAGPFKGTGRRGNTRKRISDYRIERRAMAKAKRNQRRKTG